MMKIIIYLVAVVLLIFIIRLGDLYTQLSRYQKFWDYQNKLPAEKDDFVYVAFGDSAAQGVGASSPERGYVGLIAHQIHKDTSKNVKIINLSKSGGKIRDVIDTQIPKYKELKKVDLVTIEIGANDILTFDPNKFRKEMNELMNLLPPGAYISDIPSFKGSRLSRQEPKVLEANKIIYDLAAGRDLVLVPLHEKVTKNNSLRTFAADFFHPSNYGYKTNWADTFMEKIKVE